MEIEIQDICPDEIMLKKEDKEKDKHETLSSQLSCKETLTCWDLLDQPSSALDDIYSKNDKLNGIDASEVLTKHKSKKPSVRPYISINDLNNSDDEPYLNKPKPAIEIGVTFDF